MYVPFSVREGKGGLVLSERFLCAARAPPRPPAATARDRSNNFELSFVADGPGRQKVWDAAIFTFGDSSRRRTRPPGEGRRAPAAPPAARRLCAKLRRALKRLSAQAAPAGAARDCANLAICDSQRESPIVRLVRRSRVFVVSLRPRIPK
ncbi:hypothetical protein EVAR_30831_1 [Eumeta japonica]|uniref:Uncharacterized protein n=1 Tax=Eumeta variegata TaxID=151549 RepID=A0A4C1XRU1_EUMVA|nr:hypothetical protein EVAR_30831_1 [Eumeta japonica]